MGAFVVRTLLLSMWRVPGALNWTLSGAIPYSAMEVPLVLSALWLWREVLDPSRAAGGALAVCSTTALVQGSNFSVMDRP